MAEPPTPSANQPKSPLKWTATKAAIDAHIDPSPGGASPSIDTPFAAARLSYQHSPQPGQKKRNAIHHATPPSGARPPRANQRFDGVADVSSIPTAIPFNLTAASTTTVSDLTPFNDRIPSPPRRSRNSTTDAAAALVSLSISTEDSPADAVFQPPRIVSPVDESTETADNGNESSDDEIPEAEKQKQKQKKKAAKPKSSWQKNRDDIINAKIHEFARPSLNTVDISQQDFKAYFDKFKEQQQYKFQHWNTQREQHTDDAGMATRSSRIEDMTIDEDAYNLQTTNINIRRGKMSHFFKNVP